MRLDANEMPTSCAACGSRLVVSVSTATSSGCGHPRSQRSSCSSVRMVSYSRGARRARPASLQRPRLAPRPARAASSGTRAARTARPGAACRAAVCTVPRAPRAARHRAGAVQQLARGRQPVARLAQVLAHHAADLVGVRQDLVQRAVLLQPLGRGLRPDLVHARDVVHAVADQREVVDDLVGPHAELGRHAGLVEGLVGHGVDHRHRAGRPAG